MQNDTKYLEEKMKSSGFSLSERQEDLFVSFFGILSEWNKKMNLTAITGYHDAVLKHFIDSIEIMKYTKIADCGKVIDVGTGAGFPGIPLAIICPDTEFVLLDSLDKRIKFIKTAAGELGLYNVTAVHGRAEDIARSDVYREQFDAAVSRAVARLPVLLEYCTPFVKNGGFFASYKGGEPDTEIEEAGKAAAILTCTMEKCVKYRLPDSDFERSLVIYRKKGQVSAKYPRKAGIPARKPL